MPRHAADDAYAPGPRPFDQQSQVKAAYRPAWVDPALFPFQSRFADVDGHRLHYVDEGRGPTILFLPPGPGWSFYYREFILGLRGQLRCVALDYPGFGPSVARDGYGFSLEEHSRAVEQFIETLGLRDLTLMVHDAGGPIGLAVAARRPDWFRAFIVVSTFAWPLTEYRPVRLMLRLVSSPPLRLVNAFANLLPRVVARFGPQRRRLSTAEHAAIVGAFPTWVHRGRILTLFRDLATQHAYLRAVEAGLTTRLRDRPALIMYGEFDPVRKLGFDKRFERIFPHHRSHVIAREAHFATLGAAPEMIEHIRHFWPMVESG